MVSAEQEIALGGVVVEGKKREGDIWFLAESSEEGPVQQPYAISTGGALYR